MEIEPEDDSIIEVEKDVWPTIPTDMVDNPNTGIYFSLDRYLEEKGEL